MTRHRARCQGGRRLLAATLATLLYLLGGVLLLIAARRTGDLYFVQSVAMCAVIAAAVGWSDGRPWRGACLALVLPVFTAVSSFALPFTARLSPTLDPDLDHISRALIAADSMAPVRWGLGHPLMRAVLEWTYHGLLVGVVIAWLRDRLRLRIVVWLALAAASSFAIYYLTPAAGPGYAALGGAVFRGAWRNAVPSVHFAASLFVAATLWPYGGGWRLAGAAFAILTAASTMVGAQHYAVDLVPTVPFSLAVTMAVDSRWRYATAMALLLAVWVVALHDHLLLDWTVAAIRGVAAATILLSAFTLWLAQTRKRSSPARAVIQREAVVS